MDYHEPVIGNIRANMLGYPLARNGPDHVRGLSNEYGKTSNMTMTRAQRNEHRHSLEAMIESAKHSAKFHNTAMIVRRANNGFLMCEREIFLVEQPLSNTRYPRNRWIVRVYPDGTVGVINPVKAGERS